MAVAILAARSNPDAAQAAIVTAQAMSMQSQLDFTREHEREADRVGLQTLAGAGFSAQGMGTFFERLQAQGRVYENNAPAYLRTHPLTFERIADIQNRLAEIPYRQVTDSADFLLVRARVQAAAASIVATETPTVRAGDSRPASRADTAEPAIIASTVGMKNQPKPVSGSPRCWIRNTGADST